MTRNQPNRREFVSAAALGGLFVGSGGWHSWSASAQEKPRSKVERLGVGAIGLRYQGSVIAGKAHRHGDIVAVCDVDKNVRDPVKSVFGSTPRDFENYQDLLARKDVDVS